MTYYTTALVLLALAAAQSEPPSDTRPEPGGKAQVRPVLFAPGVISTDDFETHPAFTPDGNTMYFVKSNANFTHWTIHQSSRRDGSWSKPTVAPFSGKYRDADPFITADGKSLYFISDRPVDGARQGMDIWVMQREGDAWSAPRNLDPPVNSPGNEWFPTLAESGTLYFGSDRPGGQGNTDLYCARPSEDAAWETPENLGPLVNTAADEYEPLVSPDERFIIFMASGRPEGSGRGDLFVTKHRKGKWTRPTPLPAGVNTAALEISPAFTPDRRHFLFGSTRPRAKKDAEPVAESKKPAAAKSRHRGPGDIYQVDTSALGLED